MNSIEKPIFILGCTKSGTTLMRNLFDSHNDLFIVPSESHFFEYTKHWISYYMRRTRPNNLTLQEMKLSLIEGIKKQNEAQNILADDFTFGKWNIDIFIETINSKDINNIGDLAKLYFESIYSSITSLKYKNNLRFVEKSVENNEYVLEWSKIYPKAKFIYILRNPYSNIVAIRNYQSKKNTRFPSLKPAIYAMYNSYYYLYKNLNNFENFRVVKYEDLISNPIDIMKDLSVFLGLKFNDVLTKPTLFGKNWTGNSTSETKFSGISKINLDRWKKIITPLEIKLVNELFDFILSEYDYQIIDAKYSLFKYNRKEKIRNYFLNRLFWYYLPRFR